MNQKEVRNALMKEFRTEWGSTTPIALDNQPFTPPVDQKAWVRLTVLFNSGEQATLGSVGNRLFRRYGILIIQVFTNSGKATNENDELSQQALDIFDGEQIDSIWFRNGGIKQIGNNSDKWFQQNVISEFIYNEIK